MCASCGGEVSEEALKGESVKVDVAALVGDDLYGALRARRSGARFGAAAARERAENERRRCACAADLARKLDVPPELLGGACPCDGAREEDGA